MRRRNMVRFDWAIKRLLRNKTNFVILEGFLSELLGEDIVIDNILESEGNKETEINKTNRVDLLVKNNRGEYIIIEIENDYFPEFLKRMLFGVSKLINDHMNSGMSYAMIHKVISISIVFFDLGRGEDYVYHGATHFTGINKHDTLRLSQTEQELYDTEKIADIYPEYYIIKVNQFDDVAKSTLDEWIRFLKSDTIDENTKAKGLKEASEQLDILKLSPEEKAEYDYFIKNWRDNYHRMLGKEMELRNHYLDGKQEGKSEMLLEVVINCLKKGMSLADIAAITGLKEEEIIKLK